MKKSFIIIIHSRKQIKNVNGLNKENKQKQKTKKKKKKQKNPKISNVACGKSHWSTVGNPN